ncbi:uncharacterized protein LOC110815590 [Carica papaya]|uniref:uncharacterized protein LOC110815590 n=1 Tax=Carica papaya TaxID=3649 RepID=UPI000B8CF29E|nr:uncharacterized protein LOC110815590 [Carica papaya]
MRDIVSCFSENSINISNPSCSSYPSNACISPGQIPCVQTAITSVYKVILSNQKQLLLTLTWCKNNTGQGLSINLDNDPSSCFNLNTNLRLFRKKKGSKTLESNHSRVEVYWDLSAAKYKTGPEPVDGFYVLVMVDSEIALALGDITGEQRKLKSNVPVAKVSLISRQEYCSGNALYSTKAQFSDTGITHDILINYGGENKGLNHPVLSICIDKKTVIRVKKLQLNFRGNQTIFIDGLLVDLMWDLHDWFFSNPGSGHAVFMFRTRSGMDSRLWLEEKLVKKEQDKLEFSLLIYACKTP